MNTATLSRPSVAWSDADQQRMRKLTPPGARSAWLIALDRAFAEDVYAITVATVEMTVETAWLLRSTSSDSDETYTIVVKAHREEGVRVGCTCRAGEMATVCKHAAAAVEELNLWQFDSESRPVLNTDLHDVVFSRNRKGVAQVNIPYAEDIEWGYIGSGPSHLARAVLAWAVDPQFAALHAFDFKHDVIANVPKHGMTLAADELSAWCASRMAVAA